ncbi:hypothetical protein [Brucella rhizosphaerae]|uniref:Uncharacterized protein n=2 Tax=Brucella rhizosphaerae TaxID=571254 RepID=A0A256FLB0_9HYPH|nr:hypothetical protein CEV32_4909 [Brucella rhizosphaerae]
MPFRSAGIRGAYSPSEVQIMRAAYDSCVTQVGHSSVTDEELEDFARIIIRLFEDGERDPETIAERCIDISKLMPR